MVKVWMTRTDPLVSVGAITRIMAREDRMPPDLVAAYRKILAGATPGLVEIFFTELASRCPAALRYFQEVPPDQGG